mmetsp:Transcript_11150/g.33165  ORF Transcript_11150/g.33165 Transcript_11150/m.33165 type:complete len:224 (+) Transcript_11150:433-1104(+)
MTVLVLPRACCVGRSSALQPFSFVARGVAVEDCCCSSQARRNRMRCSTMQHGSTRRRGIAPRHLNQIKFNRCCIQIFQASETPVPAEWIPQAAAYYLFVRSFPLTAACVVGCGLCLWVVLLNHRHVGGPARPQATEGHDSLGALSMGTPSFRTPASELVLTSHASLSVCSSPCPTGNLPEVLLPQPLLVWDFAWYKVFPHDPLPVPQTSSCPKFLCTLTVSMP